MRTLPPFAKLATVAILLLLLNLAANLHDVREDLTSQGLYTLHPGSVEVVDAIGASDEGVVIDVYLSSDLPALLEQGARRQQDLLDEYVARAPSGVLTYRIHEISAVDGELAKQARAQGCEEVAVGARQRDSLSVRAIYKCVVFQRGERRHVVANLPLQGSESERDALEFVLTRGLVTLMRGRPRKVAFAQGLGGPADLPGFVDGVREVFDELYGGGIEPVGVNLLNEDGVRRIDASAMDALILLDPGASVPKDAKVAIDQYLCDGGAVGWYQSATAPDERLIRKLVEDLGPTDRIPDVRRVVDTGLEPLFAHHGILHRRDLVLDPEHAVEVTLETLRGVVRAENPAIFQANQIAHEASFLDGVSFVAWPAPSSLELQQREGLEVSALIRTAPAARRYAQPLLTRNYEAMRAPSGASEQGSHVLMAVASGGFVSYYATSADRPSGDALTRSKPSSGRLLVAGSGDFLIPQRRFGYSEELADQGQRLFFESVEWLVEEDEGLAALRDRRLPPYLGEVDRATRWRVQLLNIAFVPMMFLFLVYALSLWRGHRRERLMGRFDTTREK